MTRFAPRLSVLVGTTLDEPDAARLAASFPEVRFLFAADREERIAHVPECEVLFGHVDQELLDAGASLRWVHTRSAGVDRLPFEALAARGIQLTNSSGAHGVPIAEHFLSLMLAFATGFPALHKLQLERKWNPREVGERKFEIEGQTLLVIGLGDLGATLARKASGLGMRVLGVRRRPAAPPAGVEEVWPAERLHEALARADHVALCLPLTQETEGYIGERELRAMKPTAYLYNAGRGRSVKREALLAALREGWIAGAGLDCTDPEPLPEDDPLWELPGVLLTQHTSGGSPHNSRRVTDIFMENLRRYLRGDSLKNVVDLEAGY